MGRRSRLAVDSPAGSMTEPKYELTDEQWSLISNLFPERAVGPKGGRPPAAARPCVEGIIWILRSGARWSDMPERFPSATTCWRRHKEWTESGVWKKAWARLVRLLDREGRINHDEAIADGTFSPAKKGATRSGRPNAARARRSWFSPTQRDSPLLPTRQAPALTK